MRTMHSTGWVGGIEPNICGGGVVSLVGKGQIFTAPCRSQETTQREGEYLDIRFDGICIPLKTLEKDIFLQVQRKIWKLGLELGLKTELDLSNCLPKPSILITMHSTNSIQRTF